MTQKEFEARHAQEDKLIELAKQMREMVLDMEPGIDCVSAYFNASGYIRIETYDGRLEVTEFEDGKVLYTADWDRIMHRDGKETSHESV